MRFASRFTVAALLLLLSPIARAQTTHPFITGVDANYSLDMQARGDTWSTNGQPGDLFPILQSAGANTMRIRLWTGDEGTNGLAYATTVAQRAQAAGMKPYLVIFLSDNWADFVKQPVPERWKDLNYADKMKAVEEYTHRVTQHFVDAGVNVDLFEIGNEIDFGICGEFETEWPHRVSVDYMRQSVWPRMRTIILAAENGVRKVRPNAKFVLHLAQWQKRDYCIAFWNFMSAGGVQLDYAGLSYFPTSAAKPPERTLTFMQQQIATIGTAIDKSVLICESGYPSAAQFTGQFAEWNQPIDGYTLDEPGQQKWIAGYFAMVRSEPHAAGAIYWSPEWYDSTMWSAFALFDAKGIAKPGLKSLAAAPPSSRPAATRPATQSAGEVHVYFGNLHSHTSYSDGSGTPEQAYTMARDIAKLDFLAITEHNHLLGGEKATPEKRTALYAGPADSALIPVADRFNADGKFVALYGQEFSSMSKGNHVNVFDVPAVIDVPNGKFDQLLDWMDQHHDSTGAVPVMQFNHPGLDLRISAKIQYGRDDFGDDKGWLAHMDPAVSLIELLNGEPTDKQPAGRAPQVMEMDYLKYLNLGFHLAPTGDQDNHKTDWGTITETRTGILAAELTRASLLAAMRARHVYATEDKNLKLTVRVNGHLAGDVITEPMPAGDAKIDYTIADTDEPDADYTIDVFKGTIGKGLATVVKTVAAHGNSPAGIVSSIDGVRLDQDRQYLFLRITQNGIPISDRSWTAPVWFEANQP